MRELNEPQARHLAGILNIIRPDWPVPSLLTLIWENRAQPDFPALVVAAVTKAQDRTCKTPAPIFTPGAHWPEAVRDKLPALPRCRDHDTEDAPTCRSCLADVKTGDRPETMIGKRLALPTPPVGSTKQANTSPAERIRSDLRAAKDARRAIPHPDPTEPPSPAKNQNGATP